MLPGLMNRPRRATQRAPGARSAPARAREIGEGYVCYRLLRACWCLLDSIEWLLGGLVVGCGCWLVGGEEQKEGLLTL